MLTVAFFRTPRAARTCPYKVVSKAVEAQQPDLARAW